MAGDSPAGGEAMAPGSGTRRHARRLCAVAVTFGGVAGSLAAPAAAGAQENQAGGLPTVQLPPEQDRVLSDYERACEAGDVAALVAIFTADGFVPTPEG